ncbi:MAG TPA: TolC family protein [Bacteroides sp.]|nr:TolC family protein [Bacteroides sp.]
MKYAIFHKIILITLLLVTGVPAGTQEPLDSYLVLAAENNPGLRGRFNEYLAAMETVPQAGALPDPNLAFGYFIRPVETRLGPQEFRISASQMFPWFGTLHARETMATRQASAKYEAFREARSALFNEVRHTYYSLYFNEKAISIVRDNIRILDTFRNLALVKIEAGMGSVVDRYRIDMETGDLENRLALLMDRKAALEVEFFNLLHTEQEPVLFPDTLWNRDPVLDKQAISDSILAMNHQLLSLDFQREALGAGKDLARKQGRPDFSVGVDYIFIGEGPDQGGFNDALMFPRIGITIPLYREKYSSMIREAAYLETARENEKTEKENRLETLFENTWNEYLDASRRMTLYRRQEQLAQKSIRLLETAYATDGNSFEEILRMERKLLFYALELERARTDRQAAISFMDYLRGN